ncbi:spartin [Anaeramoeba flamelloides]|uniref:Spartin n=1 Tax=Anaeramoeba flamelloides TaxID=1746091 RepID=A0AAV7YLV4_9EUKA|nr:spartin [Anaeramoeba flamelloides]
MNEEEIFQGEIPENLEAKLLLKLPSVQIYRIEKNTKIKVKEGGELLFLLSKVNGKKILFLKYFEYTCPLVKTVPTLRVAPLNYVLPLSNSVFLGASILGELKIEYIEILEDILFKYSRFTRTDPLTEEEEKRQKTRENEAEILKEVEQEEGWKKKEQKKEKKKKGKEKQKQKQKNKINKNEKVVVEEKEKQIIEETNGKKMGLKIRGGGKFLRKKLLQGATVGGQVIKKGGDKLKTKLKKNEKEAEISETTKKRMKKAKKFSSVSVKVSGTVVKFVLTTASSLGKGALEMTKETKYGKKINQKSENKKVQTTKNVVIGTLDAGLIIFDGIIDAGKILLQSTGETTVGLVTHKYGEQAGELAQDGADITLNVYKTGGKVAKVTKKAIVNTIVENGGEEWIKEERKKDKIEENKRKEELGENNEDEEGIDTETLFLAGSLLQKK